MARWLVSKSAFAEQIHNANAKRDVVDDRCDFCNFCAHRAESPELKKKFHEEETIALAFRLRDAQ